MTTADILIILGAGLALMYGLANAFIHVMRPIAVALGGAA